MLPTGGAVLLFLVCLVPGWFYLEVSRKRRLPEERTQLSEILQVTAIGLLTTGLAASACMLSPRWLLQRIDLDAWATQGSSYLRDNAATALLTAIQILTIALVLAYLLNRVVHRQSPREFRPDASVWTEAIGQRERGKLPWLGVYMLDGTFIEGVLHSQELPGQSSGSRDLALREPIFVTVPNGVRTRSGVLRVVINESQIQLLTVLELPER